MEGSFSQRVWELALCIPEGRVTTYGTIAKAAIAVGADGIFLETHPNPAKAKSDGANMLHLDHFEKLMVDLIKIRKAIS